MKSKLTFLAALVAALVFVSSAAFASGTRMASMGLTGVEPMIQKDSAQWNWNPATIALFPTLITVYWDSASNTTGGGQMILKPIHGVELYSRVSADYCSDAFKAVDAAGDPAWNHMWNFGATNQAWDLTAWGPNATDVATNLGIPGALAGFTSTVQGGLPLFFAQNLPTADIAAGFPLGVPEFLAGVAPLLAAQNIASAVPPTLAVMMATMTLAYKINNMAYGVEASVGYTEENENSNLEYKVKVGAAVGITSSMSIDAAFCFGQAMTETSGRNQFDATLGKFTYESIPLVYDLYVYARFNWQFAETQNLHVYVKYSGADHSTNYSDDLGTDLDFERTQHKLQFGISDEMNFSKDSLVYLGINVLMDQRISEYSGKFGGKYSPLPASSRNASKLASDTTAWSMALHMGAEGKIIGGLIGRLGVVHDIMLYDVDNDSDDIAVGSSARYDTRTYNYRTTASIGLAYKIGQFMLEGTLNKALFTAGPNFISGNTMT
jgi:hypothetical protein